MNLGFFKRRDTIQFSGRRHTQLGILSAVIGLAVVAGFIAVSIISGINKGQGRYYYRCCGPFIICLIYHRLCFFIQGNKAKGYIL